MNKDSQSEHPTDPEVTIDRIDMGTGLCLLPSRRESATACRAAGILEPRVLYLAATASGIHGAIHPAGRQERNTFVLYVWFDRLAVWPHLHNRR